MRLPGEKRPSPPRTLSSTPVHARIPVFATGVPCSNRRAPLATRKPRSQLLGGFAGRIGPKRHPAPTFPQVGGADSEQPPSKTAQKSRTVAKSAPISWKPPRTRRQGRGSCKRHAGETPDIAGARPRAKSRQPSTPTRAQPEAPRSPRRRSRSSRCARTQTNTRTKRAANHRAKALMGNASEAPYPPLQTATPIHPANPPRSHPYLPKTALLSCNS